MHSKNQARQCNRIASHRAVAPSCPLNEIGRSVDADDVPLTRSNSEVAQQMHGGGGGSRQ
jgi:hypothetical protein